MKNKQTPNTTKSQGKRHPWRLCPLGQYWRKGRYQNTYNKKNGTVVKGHPVSAGCCDNPSKRDQIYSEELLKIAEQNFSTLSGPPASFDLTFENGNKYDDLIRGWTKFWNDILEPKDPLDPDLVKSLIATESSFDPNPPVNKMKARGLMQVLDSTQKILGDDKGELKDHFVHVDQKDMTDPCLNIAAGTRWLFRKKDLASNRLKREATWDEGVAEYKAYLKGMIKNPKKIPKPMIKLREYYSKLKQYK